MREYFSLTLNMIEYAGIYLKKQSAEYTRILNVSDAVYSIKVTVQFTDVFRTLSNISDGMFCKKNAGAQPEIVQGREGEGGGEVVELGHFNKHFVKNTRKRGPTGKHLRFFSYILLQLHFEWKI